MMNKGVAVRALGEKVKMELTFSLICRGKGGQLLADKVRIPGANYNDNYPRGSFTHSRFVHGKPSGLPYRGKSRIEGGQLSRNYIQRARSPESQY